MSTNLPPIEKWVLRSSIDKSLLFEALWKGSLLGLIGIGFLLFGAILLPPNLLNTWGWILFLFGLGFITWGLIPYRRLNRLAINPSEIMLTENELEFYEKNKKIFTIPILMIQEVQFLKRNTRYGIGIIFTEPIDQKTMVHSIQTKKFQEEGASFKVDIFLPYFSKRSWEELQDWLKQ